MGRLQRVRPRPLALPRLSRCLPGDFVQPRLVLSRHRPERRPFSNIMLYGTHNYGGIGGAEIGMGRLQRVRPCPLALPRQPRCLPSDFVQPRLILGRHRLESRPPGDNPLYGAHDGGGIGGAEIGMGRLQCVRPRPLALPR